MEACSGRTLISRVAGQQTCGRAELQAALGALEDSWDEFKDCHTWLVTDNKNVMNVINDMYGMLESGCTDEAVYARIAELAHLDILLLMKKNLTARFGAGVLKRLRVLWVKSHAEDGEEGLLFNQQVDTGAKIAAHASREETSILDLGLPGREGSTCKLMFKDGQILNKVVMKKMAGAKQLE